MAEQITDAEVVAEDVTPLGFTYRTGEPVDPSSTALVRRERRSEVLRPLAVDQVVESFHAYQEMLPQLLAASDWQDAGRDSRTGQPRRFVKKSGWRKIATAFDLDVILVSEEVERDSDGKPLRVRVIARAISPSGRSMDGDGYCSVDEDRFAQASARKKLENDLRATATTRAKNRAISDLVGMGDVSAEEIGDDPPASDPAHPLGPDHDPAIRKDAAQACVKCAGGSELGIELWKQIGTACGGYVPHAAALALIHAAMDRHEILARVDAPEAS